MPLGLAMPEAVQFVCFFVKLVCISLVTQRVLTNSTSGHIARLGGPGLLERISELWHGREPEDWMWVLAFPQTCCVTLRVGFNRLQGFFPNGKILCLNIS